jgi:hypothetical protein
MIKLSKRVITLTITTILLVPHIAFGATKTFNDVSSYDWYYSCVTKLAEKNIIDGFEDGSFQPNWTIDTDAFIKLVICSLGYSNVQKDNNYWAAPYIQKSLELGIVKGGEFNYTEPISREGMALIISRALANEKVTTMGTNFTNWKAWGLANKGKYNDYQLDITKFSHYIDCFEYGEDWLKRNYFLELNSDGRLYQIADQVKEKEAFMFFYDWYKTTESDREALGRVLTLGVMSGYTDQTIQPHGTATRAEASSMILRMIDKTTRVKNDFKPVSYGVDYTTPEVAQQFKDAGMLIPQIVVYSTNGFNWFDLWIDNAKDFKGTDYVFRWNCISNSELNVIDMLQPNGVWRTIDLTNGKLNISRGVNNPVHQLSKSFYTTREVTHYFDLYPDMQLTYLLTVTSESLGTSVEVPVTITLLDNKQTGN